ncbi:MAG: type I-E CRISPR-associated protein Cas7/Cse4/CasC [Candidatus Wallbacteria bacterium]|nr:type I-E CRISPR-associated protein Cas7/Cse4/CasC [Candidatus Wallbacteria bacterium]
MKLIELHIIQSFPVTCLNRDDVGAPKSAYFGGVPRARVSSQCWKRAIREHLVTSDKSVLFKGKRTRYITTIIKESMEQKGFSDADSSKYAQMICKQIFGEKEVSKNEDTTKTMFYFSEEEISRFINTGLEVVSKEIPEKEKEKELGKACKKIVKETGIKDMADISLFGRMVANDVNLKIEGAAMFSHAISTHKVENDIDFFSAVDDLKPGDVEGAGHLGTLEFNSGCYYRYIGLNLDLLKTNLGTAYSVEEMMEVVKEFIKAAVLAVPNARKNSMFGFNPPAYVGGVVRSGQPLSMANAFEKPVKSRDGYIEPSKDTFAKHFQDLKTKYNLNGELLELQSIDGFITKLTEEVMRS